MNKDGDERRHDYSSLKSILDDIRESVRDIVSWKETVIDRLAKIEQSITGENNINRLKKEQCDSCKNRISTLEQRSMEEQIKNSRDYAKSNTMWEVMKYLFIALTGAFGSWLVQKLQGGQK